MCEGLARIKLILGSAGQPEKLFCSYLSTALGKTALAPYPDRGKLTGYHTSSGQPNPARRVWRGWKNYSAGPDMSLAGLEYATVRIMQGFLGMRVKCSAIEKVYDASDL